MPLASALRPMVIGTSPAPEASSLSSTFTLPLVQVCAIKYASKNKIQVILKSNNQNIKAKLALPSEYKAVQLETVHFKICKYWFNEDQIGSMLNLN